MVRNILVSTGDKEPLCNALRILITAEILTYQLLNTHTQFVSAPSKVGRNTGGYSVDPYEKTDQRCLAVFNACTSQPITNDVVSVVSHGHQIHYRRSAYE